jgi:branched-chain amino acid transport system substrate-binding protein
MVEPVGEPTTVVLEKPTASVSTASAISEQALDNVEGFPGVSGDITLKGKNGNPPKRAIVVEIVKSSDPANFQKFAKDYTPDQLK